ncbi:MAG: GC-type dockerin domain-anchored protein [Phycisphaerales bacterium]
MNMKSTQSMAFGVCICAGMAHGVALGGEDTPTALMPSAGRVVDVAHIYYNIASGERVVTLLGDTDGHTTGADTGVSGSVWSSRVSNACADFGFSNEYFFGIDNNSGTTSLATAITLVDFGDIATNTVVDCVHIDWVTDHNDVDTDSDGIGDGVVGLAGQWTWWDLENGRQADVCGRTALISFLFTDLPGDISGTTGPDDPNNTLAKYTADIDLTTSFSSSLTFEICDTDNDPQGAAVFHPLIGTFDHNFDGLPDSDLDGDGLADWGWSVRFYQPGFYDLDSDGVPDGDPADSFRTIGVSFGAPEGTAIDNGDGTWTWDIDTSIVDAGTGEEDAFAIYAPPDFNGDILYGGFFWFGGFKCVDEGSGGYTPAAMFEHQLWGPPTDAVCCPPDLNCDGVIDFFDVSQFLGEFAAGGDYNGDGVTNFFDVSQFLNEFNAGCP